MNLQEFLEHTILEYSGFHLTPLIIGLAVLFFFCVRILIFLLRKVLRRYFEAKSSKEERADAVIIIAKYFLWTLYITLTLRLLGLDITWLIASSAALLVGLGMGLQNVFNDFISGIILLFEGTVDPGDIITVDDMVGKVKRVGIRSSQMVTRNHITILVPNHKLTEDNVINWSHMHQPPRFHVTVGVAYGTDTELVARLLVEAANGHPKVEKKPVPFTRFMKFGSSSLDFELYFWCDEVFLIENVESDLRLKIDKKFRENKVIVPFPQTDLHIKSSNIPFK